MLTNHPRIGRERLLALIPEGISPEAAASIVARLIDPRPYGYGPDRAVLRERGVSVWAVIADLDATEGDRRQIAEDYELRDEDVTAALLYYQKVPDVIEARITLNRAAFTA